LLHDRVTLVGTFVAPFAGERFVGAPEGHAGVVVVVTEAELLPLAGSGVVEETLAVLTIGFGGEELTVYVAVKLFVCPEVIVPRLHGDGANVTQPPVADTKVKPVGVGSLSETLLASDGPLFVTLML
jgi:hypothetical protein